MTRNAGLTPEHVNALNSVNLQLFGVSHGIYRQVKGRQKVTRITDADYANALTSLANLDPARGDRLAVEFNGPISWAETASLADIVPASIPDIPIYQMPANLREAIAQLLETGRSKTHINNLVYTAAHALLASIPVHMADSSPQEWQDLQEMLEDLVPEELHEETGLFFRNSRTLTRLGNVAVAMINEQTRLTPSQQAEKPTLLFLSGSTHTERLSSRLGFNAVRVTTNLT